MSEYDFSYVEITPRVWQIKDDGLSYFTLVRGDRLAVVWDAGYGARDIRSFVERNVSTPYIVILSHAHPDHMLGSFRFDTAYMPERDMEIIDYYNCAEYRQKLIAALDENIRENEEICSMLMNASLPQFKKINPGDSIELGGITADVVDLAGHSLGSIGLLLREERLLLSGDALNPNLWIFNVGACKLQTVLKNLESAAELPFDSFLGGHSQDAMAKKIIYAHINNLKTLNFNPDSYQIRVGCETYTSVYEEDGVKSEVVYSREVLS